MANPPVQRDPGRDLVGGLLALLGCQLVGECLVRVSGVRMPGPVIGLVLFFAVLQWRKPAENSGLVRAPALLLRHLQLLFVPAGVGIVVYLRTLRDDAVPLAAGLWGSWVIGFAVTALVVSWLLRVRKPTA